MAKRQESPDNLTSVLPAAFFGRPAEQVAPQLVGCWLIRRLETGEHLRGLIVETEAYAQQEPACHGARRRSPQNDTLFGEPGRFYVYLTYGIHHCVNLVTGCLDEASGVLLRAVQLADEPARVAAGPGLLARRFGIDRRHDGLPALPHSGLWLAPRRLPAGMDPQLTQTTRIGISQAQELPWRWYLRASPCVSRRARGDRLLRPGAGL